MLLGDDNGLEDLTAEVAGGNHCPRISLKEGQDSALHDSWSTAHGCIDVILSVSSQQHANHRVGDKPKASRKTERPRLHAMRLRSNSGGTMSRKGTYNGGSTIVGHPKPTPTRKEIARFNRALGCKLKGSFAPIDPQAPWPILPARDASGLADDCQAQPMP